MDKVIKNKRDLELVIGRSSGYETRDNPFIGYILSDDLFLSYSKNYICKFMQANS